LKLFLVLLFILNSAFALDGVVTVLEAPLFRVPNKATKVVQYLRKGDTLYLHPSIARTDPYEGISPSEDEELLYFEASERDYKDRYTDEFVEKNLYRHREVSKYYKTIDKAGNDAYILKEHVFVYYEDERELEQQHKPVIDYTDYRIPEPLPENFPFKKKVKGYRGFISFGVGNQSNNSYPYPEDVTDQGFKQKTEFSFLWTKRAAFDEENRLYWGAMTRITMFENQFTLQTRKAKEQWFKAGIGPAMTYDIWRKNDESIVSLFSFEVNLFNRNSITQKDNTGNSERRSYQKVTFVPRFGGYYKKHNALGNLDFISGLSIQWNPPYRIQTSRASANSSWWNNTASDGYQIRNSAEFSLFIGLQSSI
jgi:hypothetical protein